MNVIECNRRDEHPKEKANFLTRITFLYNLPILWKTYKRGLFKESDLCEVIPKCKASLSGNELENCLKNYSTGKISLLKLLWRCYGKEYLLIGIIQLFVRSLVIISIPMALSKVVLYFQPGQTELSKVDAILFATLLILINFLSVTYLHNYLLLLTELGIKIRTAFCSVIYRKCLRTSYTAFLKLSAGGIVTLITKDVAAIENFIFYCNDSWVGAAQALIVFYLIYKKMGLATVLGMGFFMIVIPIQLLVGKLTTKFRLETCKKTDERLQIMRETLSVISTVKMNVWEEVFKEKINKCRKKEMAAILKIFLTKTLVLLIGSLTSKIAFYLLLIAHVFLGHNISAELIYYVTTLFLRIRHALNTAIPNGLTATAELTAALSRIKKLLESEEVSKNNNTITYSKHPYISLKKTSVMIHDEFILKNINLDIDSGLTIITGPVGSGKTTLLKTILGEYETKGGIILKQGLISYAAQEPWVFLSTFKQNIIFDEKYDEKRYHEVLDVCSLNLDLQHFLLGDQFQVGEHGINLSKGQKARLNLARAIYKKADIYLLDDPLTCLDNQVETQIFQKCIRNFLANKICVLVTQNLQNVADEDRVVILDKGKTIFSQKISGYHKVHLESLITKENVLEHVIESKDIKEDIEIINEKENLLKSYKEKKKIYQEKNESGKVGFSIYKKYAMVGGGSLVILVIFVFLIATQFSKSYTDKILSNWVNSINNNVSSKGYEINNNDTYTNLSVKLYSIFTLSTTLLSITTAILLFNFSRRASINLHKSMLNAILNAPLKFFDKCLIGNILNRFSKDLNIVDEQIPYSIYEFLEIFFGICGSVILICSINILFFIPVSIIFLILYFLRKLYMPTGRNLQRLDVATRSPVIGYLNSSLEGLVTIRSRQAEQILIEEFDRHQDLYTSANFTSICCQRAFGYYLDVSCTLFIAVIITIFLFFEKASSVGDVGLVITQAFMLTGVFQYGIRQWANIENKMTSVERILEYTNVNKEVNVVVAPTEFPKDNIIEYKNVNFSYNGEKNYVLRNINMKIEANEKVGIVGRTGAGKSTLLSLLFRLYQYEGQITVGGIDLKDIPLKVLRNHISIISQDPLLFTGTLRLNLDPTNQYTDFDIWKYIKEVHLQDLFHSLDTEISESGSNFSTGQKQIICLIRCLLSRNKIIILDEATSDIDQESETDIGKIIKNKFQDCTVFIVAHRLNTIMHCNRILVVSEGKIIENGETEELKKDQNSIFYNMLKKAGLLI